MSAREQLPRSPLDEEQRKFFSFWEGTKRGVLALERKHFNDPERQDLHDYIAHEKVIPPFPSSPFTPC